MLTNDQSKKQAIDKLSEMIKNIEIAMLTTIEQDGSLHCRPMATQRTSFDGELWFFTKANSPKVTEVNQDHNVCLSYADARNNRYVCVTGRADLVRDRQKAQELWSPAYKAWFPEGLNDPELALLKVKVEHAEYWDSASSTMVHIAGFIKVENKKLDLTG